VVRAIVAPAPAAPALPAPKVDNSKHQARGWCFTINNPTSRTLFPDGLSEGIKYIIYQFEVGAEGTPHLQGFIYFVKPKRRSAVAKIGYKNAEDALVSPFAHAHLEVARGTPQQNKDYCTKAETRTDGPWELGEFPKGSGERTDLAAAAQMLKDGKSLKDIADTNPELFIRNWRGLEQYDQRINPPKARASVKVVCIHGPAGICKSSWVYSLGDVFTTTITEAGALWMNGYQGEKRLLIDDFTGQLPYAILNRICDRWAYNAPIKGGFVAAKWEEVYILTNIDPKEWYPAHVGKNNDFVDAVYRRIGYGMWSGQSVDHEYIHLNTMAELKAWGLLKGQPLPDLLPPPPAAPAPAAPAPLPPPVDPMDGVLPDAQDPADEIPSEQTIPSRSTTPTQVDSGDEEAPKLKRHNAQFIVVDD